MSEQKESFMVQLDHWSDKNVIFPLTLAAGNGNDESLLAAKEAVRKAVRSKVLESYRNGQAAGPQKARAYAKR